ncbi:hypothetical protein B0G81_6819 [Paraburkholderia sp. BL6665CI2N2]|uniref:hypothetical protein n=1 Tax=Paraburkholderia sp. BL6665CI2N2 TaxID=1938806 RepID=UPI0010E0151E|nr:hypothetical protein [Paraburkholderia sp. BL6665CI2N2]TDY26309.1 hypothetical protein B0G81_6819 [Paraburkholderia sp. BL6665CI2N2]
MDIPDFELVMQLAAPLVGAKNAAGLLALRDQHASQTGDELQFALYDRLTELAQQA